MPIKHFIKKALRSFTRSVPVRGRHRLSDKMGAWLQKSPELLTINNFNIYIDHSLLFSRHVYYGVYEEHLINFLKRNIHQGDIVFDPGANIGYITATCLGLVGIKGHVYAFEPSKICYTHLAAHNKLRVIKNLTLHNAAISDRSGEQDFYDTPRVISRGYACLANVDSPEDGIKYPIITYSIDDYCKVNGIDHIRFLKLDIEGAELDALKGGRDMLTRKAIDYILIETDKNGEHEASNLIASYGYRPHLMNRNGRLKPVDLISMDHFRADIMWTI